MARVPDVEVNHAINERPICIERRMGRERERLIGMTDEERAWRKKWLDSQKLAPEEPIIPKGYYEEMYNPIRRFYMAPLNKFQNMLEPIVGYGPAYVTRHLIAKGVMSIIGVYCIYYHLKYNQMSWTRKGGWRITASRTMMYPDTKDLKALYKTKGNEFYVNGFDKCPI